MGLPDFSVKRRVTITMMIGILLVVGGISVEKIGVDLLPEMEFPMLSVLTQYPGVASEDIETLITKPVEEVAGQTKGVKEVRSFSQEGVSVVQVDMEWGTDLDVAAQDIRNAIGLIRDFLPEDINEPLVLKFDTTAMPVVMFGVTSEAMNTYQLRRLLEDTTKERLERLDGVASAMIMGGDQREILVEVDRDKLQARGQSLNDLVMLLRYQNLNLPGGHIVEGHEELLVRSLGEFQSVDDIGRIVIGVGQDLKPVRLRDVATVSNVPKERRDYARTERLDSVFFIIMKESGANTLDVSNRVLEEMEKTGTYLPGHVGFHLFFDSGEFIRKVTTRTGATAILGGLLAVLMIFLFLRSFRPTIAIAIAIPLSIVIAFIPLYFTGYTLNMMTLGGFALGVGMLVDNSIVVIENIYRHIEAGEDRKTAAALGAREVGNAIVAATLTTIVVFLPMMFAEGIPGQLSRGVASTVAFSLMGSLLVALTIVPMLASVFFKDKQSIVDKTGRPSLVKPILKGEGRIMLFIKRVYDPVLRFFIGKWIRLVTVLATIALLVISGVMMGLLGGEFMPVSDQEFAQINVELPVGTDLETTKHLVYEIEDKVAALPEVSSMGAWGGVSDASQQDVAYGSAQAGVNNFQVFIKLTEKTSRDRSSMQIVDQLRAELPDLEGTRYDFPDMNSGMFGAEAPIQINVYGRDLPTLKRLAALVVDEIDDIEGIRDVDSSMRQGKPELGIEIDREKAGNFGLTVGQVASEVQAAMLGTMATAYRQKGEEFEVRVRYAPRFRTSSTDIENIPLKTPLGHIRLMDVASIERGTGAVQIDRANQMRRAVISANVMDRSLSEVVEDIEIRVAPLEKKEFPQGYYTEITGQVEQMDDFFGYLVLALGLAILLVYMVMAAQFESFSQPLIVMFTLPLALIGVFLLLFITGNRFNVPSGMGLVMLAGIVVNNGIILIDYVNQLRRRGLDVNEAIVEGAKTRLRPIFITSFTTICGMLPMVVDQGEGAEMRGPMALTVIGGLLTSMVLTLVVIPAVYSIFDSVGKRVFKRKAVVQSDPR